jgi:predicted Zn-dependent protease
MTLSFKSRATALKTIFIMMFCVLFSAVQANAQSLLRDTEIEETLREFTDPILRAGGLTPSSVDIYLVNDPSLNAFVTRGQNIFLHSGLILEANTPNQLKGVIAHETGHITGGHIVRSDYGRRSAYGSMLIAAGIGLAAILAGEGQAGALVLGGSQQFGALEALSYSRVNESAADQYAADYMERTGQSGKGLIQFFEKFRAQEVLSQARRYPYFRGHPLSADRIDALRERVEESEFTDVTDTPEEIHKHAMMQAKLRGFLNGPAEVYSRFPLSTGSVCQSRREL